MNAARFFQNTLLGWIAGLSSTWVMTKAQAQMKKVEKKLTDQKDKTENGAEAGEPATVKLADKTSQLLFHHPLAQKDKSHAGNFVHYAFGSSLGALYGALSFKRRHTTFLSGLGYGALVWIFADNVMVPLMGLSKSPFKYPLKTHLYALGSHLIYGGTLGKLNDLGRETGRHLIKPHFRWQMGNLL